MDLLLLRTYHSTGVNGILFIDGTEFCKTIELPWRHNAPRISCIPEGIYRIRKRYSPRFLWHFEVLEVLERSAILLHPANDAAKELKGCIAPVLRHTGEGKGSSSRIALERLKELLYPFLDQKPYLRLTIKKASNEKHYRAL